VSLDNTLFAKVSGTLSLLFVDKSMHSVCIKYSQEKDYFKCFETEGLRNICSKLHIYPSFLSEHLSNAHLGGILYQINQFQY
jgi:hypothetical protein